MILMLAALGSLCVLLALCLVCTARWLGARALETDLGQPGEDALAAGQDRRLLLPEGHRPPPGLSPLSPSERFLAAEASRGLRDLELFLLDAA